ncbi:thiol:disulfide interchange protein DsbA/DsbL [Luteimonas mephitis]|uniref:thiol:disulfide interchange protein DsbA/DsbL n=1 Tax=Luteimonas mephitis TaxID=83615 RepID=UPI0004122E60|nr:thiol:disulfide interchange protein DsbA/DsbL [Luteimonas mephitis]
MNQRLALLSLLLLPLMACSRQEPAPVDAAAQAPAADAPAAEAASDATAPVADADAGADAGTPAAAGDAAEAATDAPAPPPAPPIDPNAGAMLVEGRDYVEIPNGQPFEPRNGKVEVVEVFGYVCPACANFQPLVRSWKAKLPADVRFTYVPAIFGGTWDDYARAFYAAESMGLVDKTHDALYQAIHLDQTLKGERGRDSVQDIAAFYGKHGADPKQFASTMSSFAINAKVSRAKQFAMRSQIGGTPSLVIDGKYLVKGSSYQNMLDNADQLIAKERAAGQ